MTLFYVLNNSYKKKINRMDNSCGSSVEGWTLVSRMLLATSLLTKPISVDMRSRNQINFLPNWLHRLFSAKVWISNFSEPTKSSSFHPVGVKSLEPSCIFSILRSSWISMLNSIFKTSLWCSQFCSWPIFTILSH